MIHYCSTTDVQNSITLSGGRFDNLYGMARDAATADMNGFMRRTFEAFTGKSGPFGKYGRGPQSFYLGDRFVSNVVVAYAEDLDYTNATPLVLGTDYSLDADLGKVSVWPAYTIRDGAYWVTWDGGLTATNGVFDNPPADLKLAAIQQAQFWFQKLSGQTQGNQQDVKKKQIVARQKTIGGLLPEVAAACARYRVNFTKPTL